MALPAHVAISVGCMGMRLRQAVVTAGGGSNFYILGIDVKDGPITGGESSKGCYVSLYVIAPTLAFSDLGSTAFVTIGGVNVDNYRCLEAIKGGSSSYIYSQLGVKRLTFQVGAIGSPTLGVALKVDMTISGAHPSNGTDGSGNYYDYFNKYDGTSDTIMFTPTNGTIKFVDPDSIGGTSNNANSGTITSPIKDLQTSTGSGGALKSATGAGQTNGTPPGTHVIIRACTYDGGLGNGASAVNLFRIGGCAPTASSNTGSIVITSYPGAAGANSPETVTISGRAVSSSGGGGFFGNDNARSNETSPWDSQASWAKWWTVSNITINSSPNGERDAAPINMGNGAHYCRFINNQLKWLWVSNSSGITNAAAITGNGQHVRIALNYVPQIDGVVADLQNHAVYLDTGDYTASSDVVVTFNHFENLNAGNGVQTYASGSVAANIDNIAVHNNYIKSAKKHGLNLAAGTAGARAWNNVIVNTGEDAMCAQPGNTLTSAGQMGFFNNTVDGWGMVAANRYAMADTGGTGSGSVDWRNNILRQKPSHSANSYAFIGFDNAGTNTASYNQYYDPDGRLTTRPSEDSTGAVGDPLFTNASTEDYSLQAGSPCLNAATTTPITRAYDFLGKSWTGTADRGAFEFGAS